MDAVQFLLEEHKKVKQRFAAIEQAAPAQRLELWRALEPELKIHEEIEDTYLFAPISREPAAKGTKAGGFEEHQDKDVAALEKLILGLHQMNTFGDEWLAQLRKIRDALMDHVKEEEQEILPEISKLWDSNKLTMAGKQMEAAKQEAMQNPARYATMLSQRPTSEAGGAESAVHTVTSAASSILDAVKGTVKDGLERTGLAGDEKRK